MRIMATDLTPELRQAIEAASGPLELVDRQTNKHYIVIQAEMFQRLIATLDLSEQTEQEKVALIQALGKSAGWEDPASDDLI